MVAIVRVMPAPTCFARLQASQPEATSETVLVYQEEAVHLAQLLLATIQTKKKVLRALQSLFRQHPDHPVFASLPGAGDLLAPALLTKFGYDASVSRPRPAFRP